MKNFFYIVIASSLLYLFSLLILSSKVKAAPGCWPKNPWTNLCDSGYTCPPNSQRDGFCCDNLNECDESPPPQGNQFLCTWNGTSCVVGIHNCDPSTGNPYPDPRFCAQFTTQTDCEGRTEGCVANLTNTNLTCTPPGSDPNTGINTAIGCIPVAGTQAFTEFLLKWGMGIAGGIAILLIIYATFLVMTSAGNPQRLQAGKELLTAAVMGLALLLFGAFILQLIGVSILNIPEFGG